MAMKLKEYLAGIRAATTADELEAALQADFAHSFSGPTWTRISNARIEVGEAICRANPNGRFVPVFGPRRRLVVCGDGYRVGRGGNSAGVRYAWAYAKEWAVAVMEANGLPKSVAERVWDSWGSYPHRCLAIVAEGLNSANVEAAS